MPQNQILTALIISPKYKTIKKLSFSKLVTYCSKIQMAGTGTIAGLGKCEYLVLETGWSIEKNRQV